MNRTPIQIVVKTVESSTFRIFERIHPVGSNEMRSIGERSGESRPRQIKAFRNHTGNSVNTCQHLVSPGVHGLGPLSFKSRRNHRRMLSVELGKSGLVWRWQTEISEEPPTRIT